MNVLVTGDRGFIGSHLLADLSAAGHEVFGFDLKDGYDIRNLVQLQRRMQQFQIDGVIHLAALTTVQTCQQQPQQCYDHNVIGTANVIQAAREQNVQRFVFASTGAVYGGGDETHCRDGDANREHPRNHYGMAKHAAELVVRQGIRGFNILRYANVYGPGMIEAGKTSVVAKFLQATGPVKVNPYVGFSMRGPWRENDGTTRDFVHIKDVVRANIAALEGRLSDNSFIMNVATGVGTTVGELARLMKKEIEEGTPLKSDVLTSILNADKFKRDLGAPVSLEEGIADLCHPSH